MAGEIELGSPPWSRTKARERPGVTSDSQPLVIPQFFESGSVQSPPPVREGPKDFAATLLLRPASVPPDSGDPGRLMTVQEVAKRLGVSRATVYRLCERGKIPHIRISNAVRVKAETLEQFLRHTP